MWGLREIAKREPPWVGVLEPRDEQSSVLTIGGNSGEDVTAFIVYAGVEFTLLEPLELARPVRAIATRLLRGTMACHCTG